MDGKGGWSDSSSNLDGSPDSGHTDEPLGEHGDWRRHHRHHHHRHHDDDKGWGQWEGWGSSEDDDGDRMSRVIGLSVGAVLLATFIIIAIFSIVCIMKKKRARMVHSEKIKSVFNDNAHVGDKKPPLPIGDVWAGPPATGNPPPPYETLVVDQIPEKAGGGYLDPTASMTVPLPPAYSGDSNPV